MNGGDNEKGISLHALTEDAAQVRTFAGQGEIATRPTSKTAASKHRLTRPGAAKTGYEVADDSCQVPLPTNFASGTGVENGKPAQGQRKSLPSELLHGACILSLHRHVAIQFERVAECKDAPVEYNWSLCFKTVNLSVLECRLKSCRAHQFRPAPVLAKANRTGSVWSAPTSKSRESTQRIRTGSVMLAGTPAVHRTLAAGRIQFMSAWRKKLQSVPTGHRNAGQTVLPRSPILPSYIVILARPEQCMAEQGRQLPAKHSNQMRFKSR